jgi:copper chaperone CopZ
MAKGLTPGAALVLLMAGPAVNSASILVIGKVFGKRTLSLYVLSIIIGAVVFGLGIDYLLPQDWFAVSSVITEGGHCAHCLTVWDWIFLIVLALLLVNALVFHRHHHDHDHHGHEEENEAHSHAHKTTVYKVEGMACNHCKAAVKNAIDVIPGVEKVEVDLAGGKAYVYGKHNTEEVVKAVGERGYNTMLLEE